MIGSMAVGPLAGCAASEVVPIENQDRSKERYGEQQMMMQGLNQTPAEQAAAGHENATRPVEQPGEEKSDAPGPGPSN